MIYQDAEPDVYQCPECLEADLVDGVCPACEFEAEEAIQEPDDEPDEIDNTGYGYEPRGR